MKAVVVSAFPATGKTFLFENYKKIIPHWIVLDSDSSQFSWIIKDGEKVRNPEFPQNYINHIKENMDKANVIFVSSHTNVRECMKANGINYHLAYPKRELKNEYLKRCKKRGSDGVFIKMLKDNWDSFIDSCEKDVHCFRTCLTSGMYLWDIFVAAPDYGKEQHEPIEDEGDKNG